MIVQPFNTEVGAGTLNPATILRVLGPEPWRVGLRRAERAARRLPVRREPEPAADPHPVPGDPQARPGQPAGALPRQPARRSASTSTRTTSGSSRTTGPHPALGAWGLGWEVWLDGLEITQFTYFQQAGGMTLDPVSRRDHLRHRAHHHGAAGRRPLQGHRVRAGHLLRRGVRPGRVRDEPLLPRRRRRRRPTGGCSRPTRPRPGGCRRAAAGAGAHVRPEVLARVQRARLPRRDQHHRAGQRVRAGCGRWPARSSKLWASAARSSATRSGVRRAAAARCRRRPTFADDRPARHRCCSRSAPRSCRPPRSPGPPTRCGRRSTAKLAATRLAHGEVRSYGTPRRIVALVDDVSSRASRTPSGPSAARGPAAAYDADGKPTKAAQGFARGQGVDVDRRCSGSSSGRRRARRGRARPTSAGGAAEVLSGVLGRGRRPSCAPRRTCGGTTRSCRSAGRSAGWSRCSATTRAGRGVGAGVRAGTTRVHRTAAQPVVDGRRPPTATWSSCVGTASSPTPADRRARDRRGGARSWPRRSAARSTSTARRR